MLLALVHGTELAMSFGKDNGVDVNLSIFLPNCALLPFIFSLKKHHYLHYSTRFTLLLMEFLGDSSSLVRLYGYSANWSGLPGLELAQNAAASPPPPLTLSSQLLRSADCPLTFPLIFPTLSLIFRTFPLYHYPRTVP